MPQYGLACTPRLPSVQTQDIPKMVKIGASGQVCFWVGSQKEYIVTTVCVWKKYSYWQQWSRASMPTTRQLSHAKGCGRYDKETTRHDHRYCCCWDKTMVIGVLYNQSLPPYSVPSTSYVFVWWCGDPIGAIIVPIGSEVRNSITLVWSRLKGIVLSEYWVCTSMMYYVWSMKWSDPKNTNLIYNCKL